MPIDLATLGKRLSDARNNCGLTQEQVADATGLPRLAIVHIEGGDRSVSISDLSRLAELYGLTPNEFFEASFRTGSDPLLVLGRMDQELTKDARVLATIRRYVDVCREAASIKRDLQVPDHAGPPTYRHGGPAHFAEADEQGRVVADQERNRLDLGSAAVPNLTELVASQGIWVAKTDLPDDVAGLFIHDTRAGMLIIVNKIAHHGEARRRFSLAHEYAHALFDCERQAVVTSASTADQLIERRANAFAGAFLMPAGGVAEVLASLGKGGPTRRHYATLDSARQTAVEAERRTPPHSQEITYQDVVILQLHFGVSYQAACVRLKDLRHINPAQYDALLLHKDQARRWSRVLKAKNPEFDTVEEDALPLQVVPLLVEAHRRELISGGFLKDVARKMDLPAAEILELADAE